MMLMSGIKNTLGKKTVMQLGLDPDFWKKEIVRQGCKTVVIKGAGKIRCLRDQ